MIPASAGGGWWRASRWRPRQESNLYLALRRRSFCPLNYGGAKAPILSRGVLLAEQPHRRLEPGEREREHAVVRQLLHDRDALAVLPHALRLGVDPGVLRERVGQALDPLGARLLVVVLDAAAGLQDLVRAHRRVADQDELVVLVVLADHVPGGRLLGKAPAVVLPHEVVDAVVEVVELEVLELALGGAEQLLDAVDRKSTRLN